MHIVIPTKYTEKAPQPSSGGVLLPNYEKKYCRSGLFIFSCPYVYVYGKE